MNLTHTIRHPYNFLGFIRQLYKTFKKLSFFWENINNVLARNSQNVYLREFKRWNFFRAKAPDELRQIDFWVPISVQSEKYWFLVWINDYSRFIVCAKHYDRELPTAETEAELKKQKKVSEGDSSDYRYGLKSNERVVAACVVLKRFLRVRLSRRTRAKERAFKT